MTWFGYKATDPQIELSKYVPYYLAARRRALRKSLRQMKKRLDKAVGVS
jgi:hypothetical protein